MSANVTAAGQSKSKREGGLRFWMQRVLEECERVRQDFAADPVHDLRVALRRCRSMADGVSPQPSGIFLEQAVVSPQGSTDIVV